MFSNKRQLLLRTSTRLFSTTFPSSNNTAQSIQFLKLFETLLPPRRLLQPIDLDYTVPIKSNPDSFSFITNTLNKTSPFDVPEINTVLINKLNNEETDVLLIDQITDHILGDSDFYQNKLSDESLLKLIQHFMKLGNWSMAFDLKNTFAEQRGARLLMKFYHLLFNYNFENLEDQPLLNSLIKRLKDMKFRNVDLDSILIYEIYKYFTITTTNNKEISENLKSILENNDIYIEELFKGSLELEKMDTVEKLDEIYPKPGRFYDIKIRKLINDNKVDECLEYTKRLMLMKKRIKLKDSTIDLVFSNYLKQDRLDESWFFLKYMNKLNDERNSRIIIDYLYSSNQTYFILPYVSMLHNKPDIDFDLDEYSWKVVFQQRKDTFNLDDQNWFFLTRGLVALSNLSYYPKIKRNFLNKIRSFLKTQGINDYDPYKGESEESKNLRYDLRFLYEWKTLNPIFNLETNIKQFKCIAILFNPEIASIENITLNQLILSLNFKQAMKFFDNEILSKGKLKKYHIFQIVNYYIRKYDLIELINFIERIETETNFRIKYQSLNQFLLHLLKNKKDETLKQKKNGSEFEFESIRVLFEFLYQETGTNNGIWRNFGTLRFLEKSGLHDITTKVRLVQYLEDKDSIEKAISCITV